MVDKALLIIIAILLPPVAVFMVEKGCTGRVCLNVFLCFLFGIPGLLHALYTVLTMPDEAQAPGQVHSPAMNA